MRHKAPNRALLARAPASLEAVRALGEIEAQRLAPEMVRLLGGLAHDDTILPERLAVLEFRKACAEAVLDRALGRPIERKLAIVQDFAAGNGAGEVAETLAAATKSADLYREINEYVGRRPLHEWPDHIRDAVEGAEAYDVQEQEEATSEP